MKGCLQLVLIAVVAFMLYAVFHSSTPSESSSVVSAASPAATSAAQAHQARQDVDSTNRDLAAMHNGDTSPDAESDSCNVADRREQSAVSAYNNGSYSRAYDLAASGLSADANCSDT